ncbi:MAG: PAS domain S-box protein [Leptolyngbya sp.]|nr:PAS domain S-box protein [Leptolyngbya sp.]
MSDSTTEQLQIIESRWLEGLSANQSILQGVLDALPIATGLYQVSPEGKILHLNPSFTDLFGYFISNFPSLEEWLLLSYHEPDQRQQIQDHWSAMVHHVQKTQQPVEPQEFKLLCRDGYAKNVLVSLSPIQDLILISFTDITDVKAQEEQLSNVQSEYLTILENAPIAIASYLHLEDNPKIVFMNKRAQALFGYSLDEIATVSKWFKRVYPDPAYRQEIFVKWHDLIDRQQNTGAVGYLQGKVTNKQNEVLDILFGAIISDDQVIVTMQDLTEFKTVESELDQAREALAKTALAITEAIPVGTYTMVKQPDQPLAHFSFMSERFLQLTGLERQEAESDPLKAFACVHPEDYDAWFALNAEAFAQKRPFYGETRVVVDGNIRWITAESVPRDLPDGTTVWEGVLADITKAKHYEEELKQAQHDLRKANQNLEDQVRKRTAELEASRSKFQRLLDDIGDKFVIFSHTDSIITYISNGVSHIFGVSHDEVIGQSWITAVNWHPDSLKMAETEIAKMMTSHDDIQMELCFTRPDGIEKIVSVVQHGVWDEAGNLVAIDGLAEDITERKKALVALETSEAKYRSFIETANDIIYSINPEGYFTYLSPNLEDILGFAPEELYGLPFVEVLHPDDVDHCREFFGAVLSGERKRGLEYRIIHKDGSWRWHTSSAFPQVNERGEVIAFMGFGYDTTERKIADLKQQELNQALIKANRLKDEFLAMMSHELRTPLNSILGMAESLKENIFGDINTRQEKAIQTIERSGDHLLSLINDILDMAKIEAGKVTLDRQPVIILSLCESSLVLVDAQARKKNIQLNLALPPHLPKLYVDESRIRQVLLNLLNNAVKFTPDHGQVTLGVIYPVASEDQSQPQLRLTVQDTGIGISAEDMERLFQPFVQIDSTLSRQHEGTGLGLVLVKKIVDLHGGTVSLTSEVGVGSCFMVDLPIASPDQDTAPLPSDIQTPPRAIIPAQPRAMMTNRPDRKPPRILIAEDNSANALTMKNYLEAKGYHLLTATTGEEALHIVNTETPDVVVMDIQMPNLNGIDAIVAIRANPQFQDLPIIVLTALVMEEEREKCLMAGANEYLRKPVRLRTLWETIEHLYQSANPHPMEPSESP